MGPAGSVPVQRRAAGSRPAWGSCLGPVTPDCRPVDKEDSELGSRHGRKMFTGPADGEAAAVKRNCTGRSTSKWMQPQAPVRPPLRSRGRGASGPQLGFRAKRRRWRGRPGPSSGAGRIGGAWRERASGARRSFSKRGQRGPAARPPRVHEAAAGGFVRWTPPALCCWG